MIVDLILLLMFAASDSGKSKPKSKDELKNELLLYDDKPHSGKDSKGKRKY